MTSLTRDLGVAQTLSEIDGRRVKNVTMWKVNAVLIECLVDVTTWFRDLILQRSRRGRTAQTHDNFKLVCLSRPKCYDHQHDPNGRLHRSCADLGL